MGSGSDLWFPCAVSFDSSTQPTEGAPLPLTAAATFCATLVDEWVRAGTTDAFVAPGSRSTPMALALAGRSEIAVHVFHDERSASFAAVGHGLDTGRPAVVLCSSGTAGTHMHGAVVEAHQSAVPMLVCTADRPPRLWNVSAPQVINQTELFGGSVRRFVEPGVPDTGLADTWRSLASSAWLAAMGSGGAIACAGPVHLNLSFDDPLVGVPDELPPGRLENASWHAAGASSTVPDLDAVVGRLVGRTGVIIAGAGVTDSGGVLALANHLGWPVLCDHRSGCRRPGASISFFDSLLRHQPFVDTHRPQVILRFGEPLASKVLSQWITSSAAAGAEVIVAAEGPYPRDPERVAGTMVSESGFAMALLERLPSSLSPSPAADAWLAADSKASGAIAATLSTWSLSEPAIAQQVVASVPADGALVLSSSMPVRDVEWFGGPRAGIRTYANRGANGIDGVISTALGVALTGRPTTLLIGDVAFLHDSAGLIAAAQRSVDLSIVLVNNGGGGIFSFLPQAEQLPAERFEQLFGTPHNTDFASLAAAHHLEFVPFTADTTIEDLTPRGLRIFHAETGRPTNVENHAALHAAVAVALG